MNAPNIYQFLNYRTYLQAWFDAKKQANPRYSHRAFVRSTGQKSPSFLSDVMKGRRNLSPETADAFARVMKLSRAQKKFFQLLVQFQHAETDPEKQRIWDEISSSKRFQIARRLEGEAFKALAHWQYSAIQQLARRSDFRPDPHWIATNLRPTISPKLARQALEVLMDLGLLVQETPGRLTAARGDLATPPEVVGLAARSYHREMLELASKAIVDFPAKRRFFSGVTLAVPRNRIEALQEQIQEMAQQLIMVCEETDDPPDEVVQINLHFFPLSTVRKTK